ncbi:hypothetical protein [Mucilaginibacter glaciei]|uniref:DUF2946 domain-containing protein n=1 Tax=Mucilaginibacter glaciei TaxID=2772109 RepID=A0A926S2G3_9SPHI|nr:hypothetical protein [Mucilaginibacter glaciei]MBD1395095.1 hypothetical protein [Mucilaginibacter glaciei]
MKKNCAIIMTSFYLLLTTGVYACLLHCTADYISENLLKSAAIHAVTEEHEQDEKGEDDDCRKGDCDCCYHHGSYVVKENYHPVADYKLTAIHVAIIPSDRQLFFYVPEIFTPVISWPRSTGPPYFRSRPLYISNRTLLI